MFPFERVLLPSADIEHMSSNGGFVDRLKGLRKRHAEATVRKVVVGRDIPYLSKHNAVAKKSDMSGDCPAAKACCDLCHVPHGRGF